MKLLFFLLVLIIPISYVYADQTYIFLIPENNNYPSSNWLVEYTKPNNVIQIDQHHGQGGQLFDIKLNTVVKIYQNASNTSPDFYFVFSDGTSIKTYTFTGNNVTYFYKTVFGSNTSNTGNNTSVIGTNYFIKVIKNNQTKSIEGILGSLSLSNNQTFMYSIYDYYNSTTFTGNVTLVKNVYTPILYVGNNISHKFLVTLYDQKSIYTFILEADTSTLNALTFVTRMITNLLIHMFGKESFLHTIMIISFLFVGLDFYYNNHFGVMLASLMVIVLVFYNVELSQYNISQPSLPVAAILSLVIFVAVQYLKNER
ncbi:MAG: hypothetical protein QXT65_04485 [Candidatus Nitrosocaldaceae archaeon]